MRPPGCPNRQQLSTYLLGTMPERETEEVIRHIESCPRCETAVQALETAVDSLVAQVRQPVSVDPFAEEPQCRQALDQAAQLGLEAQATQEPSTEVSDLGSLGQYQLLEKLGQGGMGTVYTARHAKLDRVVALKMLSKHQMADDRAVGRFEREMKAVGRLDHPNVVRATDAGEHQGTPFLVMEYVDGCDLGELVRRLGPLPVADACELTRQAAQGLQAAHEHGLVHRDVKPSNLMLTRTGELKILDLGLARFQADRPTGEEMTATGQAMGTADYMAPEQASDSRTADIRADIYSLGCTLYKLLSGHAPFSGPQYRSNFEKMMAHVQQPVPPIRDHRADVPDELAAVLERMLAKDLDQRYTTPADVAEALAPLCAGCDLSALATRAVQDTGASPAEVDKSLAGTDECVSSALAGTEPSHAPKPAPAQHAARRRWKPLAVAAALAGIVLLGVVLTLTSRHGTLVVEVDPSEEQDVQIAVRQGGELVEILNAESGWAIRLKSGEYDIELKGSQDRFEIDRNAVTVRRGDKVTVRVALKRQPADARPTKSTSSTKAPPPEVPAEATLGPGTSFAAQALSDRALVSEPDAIEGVTSWTLETRGHRGAVRALRYSPDGRLLATGSDDGTLRLWDPTTGTLRRALVRSNSVNTCIDWSPDGNYLVQGGAGIAGGLCWLRDVQSGLVVLGHPSFHHTAVTAVAWSPDGQTVASLPGGQSGVCFRWYPWRSGGTDEAPSNERAGWAYSHVFGLAWSPDGLRLAAGGDNAIRLWDTRSWKQLPTIDAHLHPVRDLAWSPDGTTLASTSAARNQDLGVKLWDPTTGELQRTLPLRRHGSTSLAWAVGGKLLAAAGTEWDSRVLVHNVETGKLLYARPHPAGDGPTFYSLAGSPDGSTLAAGDSVGAAHLWTADSGEPSRILPGYHGTVHCAAFSPDGASLACGYPDGAVRIWQVASGRLLSEIDAGLPVRGLAGAPDGRRIVTMSFRDPKVRVWNVESSARLLELDTKAEPTAIAWSPDGKTIATGGGKAVLWDADSGQRQRTLPWPGNILAWSPDSRTLAVSAERDEDLQLVDAASGQPGKVLPDATERSLSDVPRCLRVQVRGTDPCGVAAWSPDGRTLAVSRGWTVSLWDANSGTRKSSMQEHGANPVISLRWLANGKILVAGGSQGQHFAPNNNVSAVVVWDAESGKLIRVFDGADGAAFSPDGRLFVARADSAVRLHRLDDGRVIRTMLSLRDQSYAVISPEGHYRGSPEIEQELVYVVQTAQSQDTLTPKQFTDKYGWRNDPQQVRSGIVDSE